jgi:hypothetical protein
MKPALLYSIIGAGVAVTIIAGAVFMMMMPQLTAQGQEQQRFGVPPNDTRIVDVDQIRSRISNVLTSGRLIDYKLYENGRAEYVFEIGAPNSNRTMTVNIDHPYGAAQGYIYNSSGIFAPDGSQRLIIPTE